MAAGGMGVDTVRLGLGRSEMHLQSTNLLAMSKTVLELRKCTNTIPNLTLYVHLRSSLRVNTVFC